MEKWNALAEAMKATDGYFERRLTGCRLARQYHADRAIARFDTITDPWRVVAYIARWKTADPAFEEIGSTYVAPELSGNGVLRELMRDMIEQVDALERVRPFLITRNPAISKCALEFGFKRVTKVEMPNVGEWARRTGLSDRLPETALRNEPCCPSSNERWLMIRS